MLDYLKEELKNIAFMLVTTTKDNRKEIHSALLKCMLVVEKMQDAEINKKEINRQSSEQVTIEKENHLTSDDAEEINKVSRKLSLWAKPEKQNQCNSKILNAYLSLRNSGLHSITKLEISQQLDFPSWFDANFTQMTVKADRNHGKIFDLSSGYVELWKPIQSAIDEYEQKISKR